jgi:ABC-2 type transport system ATP-binding protein
MSGWAVEARGLTKSYGSRPAVVGVDLAVHPGVVLGFLGPNGAGKTTVIRILSTILEPDGGDFCVAGIPRSRPLEIRRHIGVLPESAGYPPGQTGAQWLVYHARLFGHPRDRADAIARHLLEEVGLADRGDVIISSYSRGMRQRLGIAGALVNEPAVLFLDEPTLGLDPIGQAQVLRLISGVARERGVTVVLSTHVLGDVEEICGQVVILNRGRIVAEGTVAEVVRRASTPRRARVLVPAEMRDQAVQALLSAGLDADGGPHLADREVRITLPRDESPEWGANRALAGLVGAGVPVTGFTLEGGRLSDAFLAVTDDGDRESVLEAGT